MLQMRWRYRHIQRWFSIFQLDPEFSLISNKLESGSNGNQCCSTAIHTTYRQHSFVHSHRGEKKKCGGGGGGEVKLVNHNYIYIFYTDFFIWTGFEKLMEFHVMFFQSAYIWLIPTKLILLDNKPTKFHQSHSAVLEMKHANRWTLHPHYTFFSWTSGALYSEIMYKIEVMQN